MYKANEVIGFPRVIKKKYIFVCVSVIWIATIAFANTSAWLIAEAPRLLFTLFIGYALMCFCLWCMDKTVVKFATTQANRTVLKLDDAIKIQTPIMVRVLKEEIFQKTWIGPQLRTAVDPNGKRYSVVYNGSLKNEFSAKLYILEDKFFTFRQRFAIVPYSEKLKTKCTVGNHDTKS